MKLILITGFALFVISGSILAQLPEIISRDVLFGNPEKISPQISSDGKLLGYIAPYNGVLNVWIRTIGKNDDHVVTNDRNRGIRFFLWPYDNKQILYAQDKDGDENWHLYAVDITQENPKERNLTPFPGVQVKFCHFSEQVPEEVLIQLNKDNPRAHDVYWLNIRTGELKLVLKNPGNYISYQATDKLEILGAVVMLPSGGGSFLVRQSVNDEFKDFISWGPDDTVTSLFLSKDGKYWYYKSDINKNFLSLYRRELSTGKEELIYEPEKADIDRVFVDQKTMRPLALRLNYLRSQWYFLDDNIKPEFDYLASIHEGDFGVIDRDLGDKTWIVAYLTDDGPVYYYTYDRAQKKTEFLFSHQPKLEGLKLAKMKPLIIKASDGLEMVSYLTVPVGVEAKNLPMVLLVHGGPWHRDSWGYNSTSQWLANRGYAVLQVNFRGSTGLGKAFLNAGNRQWGKKMHTDLLDAVDWAIKEGIADPKKIAIMGGSYGGYAALAGAAFTPDVFRCAIDIVGPSNIKTLVNSIPPYWAPLLYLFRHRVGDWDKEPELIKEMSPLYKADQIKIPMLIGQGKNDPRVKVQESLQIVEALKKNGKPVIYLEFPDEGHGFAKPENTKAFNAVTEKFLAEYLGGRYEPASKPEQEIIDKVKKD